MNKNYVLNEDLFNNMYSKIELSRPHLIILIYDYVNEWPQEIHVLQRKACNLTKRKACNWLTWSSSLETHSVFNLVAENYDECKLWRVYRWSNYLVVATSRWVKFIIHPNTHLIVGQRIWLINWEYLFVFIQKKYYCFLFFK